MTTTRAVLALLVLASAIAIDPSPSAAQYRPWCVQYFDRSSGTTCTFSSFEQCRATARGDSHAHCVRNPWYGERGTTGRGGRQRSW
jgi:Protein of unknown function (DUF3551)